MTSPQAGRNLFRQQIQSWLGTDALSRFQAKQTAIKEEFEGLLVDSGLLEPIQEFLENN